MREQQHGLKAWLIELSPGMGTPLMPGETDPSWQDLDPEQLPCGARHPGGVFCTRDRGHTDWHVAHHTGGYVLATWRIGDDGMPLGTGIGRPP